MAKDEKTVKNVVKDRLDEELHPAESEDARYDRLALEALVSLLGSEDETIRLHAAQAILTRSKAPPVPSAATGLIERLAKGK